MHSIVILVGILVVNAQLYKEISTIRHMLSMTTGTLGKRGPEYPGHIQS